MTKSDERTADALGICPGCDLPASVGAPCDERACARRGLHAIPLAFGLDLPRDRDPNLGRIIDGMLLVGVLGVGGFGRVYRAVGPAGEVAVKLANTTPRGGADPIAAERLRREARALAALDHENIVRLLGSGAADGVPYLVLEHVAEAQSLEALIAAHPERFDASTIFVIVAGILDALTAAHAQGIVHRDVKPENVLVLHDLDVRVLDFGLAHSDEHKGERPRSATVGTPTHMAPEQLSNSDIGPWTDCYGVGVIAFELMTGRLPFAGKTASAVLRERSDPRRDVLDDAPELPEAVLDFLAMALADSPRDRFQSAAGMRAALEDALEGWDEFSPSAQPAPQPSTPLERVPVSERATLFEASPLDDDLQPARDSSIETRAKSGALTLIQLAPLAAAALLTVMALGGRRVPWSALELGAMHTRVAIASIPTPPSPEPPPQPTVDPTRELRRTLVDHARRGTLVASEIAAFEAACAPELGCRATITAGDVTRGLRFPEAGPAAGTLVLTFPAHTTAHAPDDCGARARRSRAIVGGAWDEIDAAWGGYVQPRIVLEAKQGRAAQVRKVLVDRATTRDALASGRAALDAGVAVSIDLSQLGGVPLKALEELRFQAVEGRFGEEGKNPCRLDAPRAWIVAPALGAVDP